MLSDSDAFVYTRMSTSTFFRSTNTRAQVRCVLESLPFFQCSATVTTKTLYLSAYRCVYVEKKNNNNNVRSLAHTSTHTDSLSQRNKHIRTHANTHSSHTRRQRREITANRIKMEMDNNAYTCVWMCERILWVHLLFSSSNDHWAPSIGWHFLKPAGLSSSHFHTVEFFVFALWLYTPSM